MNRSTVVTGLALMLGACSGPDITVDNAWIRTPPPGIKVAAAYLDLHNRTDETITLVNAASDAYGSVTIHESRVIDGIWEMTPLPSLTVDAGAQVRMRPGGLHLMMMDANRLVTRGDTTSIRLQFADGRLVNVQAVVHDSAP